MELWIRSQDKKKLVNAKSFELDNYQNGIFCNDDNDYYICAGKYKSKERALEVLDEIQKQLIGKKGLITTQDKKGIEFIPFTDTVVVYEMPKE